MMKLWKAAFTLGAVAGVAACSDATAPAPGSPTQVSLSFASKASTGGGASRMPFSGPAFDVTVVSGTNTLVIKRVQVVVRKIELKMTTTGTCPDSSSGSDDCEELAFGPLLVDLPLTPGVATPIGVAIPAGTYRKLELEIHKPSDDPRDRAFQTANPTFADTSIRVQGTYNGQAFTFTSRLNEEVEMVFNPPITVGSAGQNVTVQIDLTKWFRNSSGAVIDPTTANAGGPNEAIVKANIKASLGAVEDDNKDGKDDKTGT